MDNHKEPRVTEQAANKIEEIRALLEDTYGFASTSPRSQENINAALDLLDELAALTRQAAPEASTEPVAKVTAGSGFGPGLAFLATGKDFPKPGTLLYTAPATQQAGATIAHPAATTTSASTDEQSNVLPPFAAPASNLNSDERVEAIGEVAELYGRLLAHKQRVHAEKGRDRGTEYYIADGIRWAIGELDRRFRAQGGNTNANSSGSFAASQPQKGSEA